MNSNKKSTVTWQIDRTSPLPFPHPWNEIRDKLSCDSCLHGTQVGTNGPAYLARGKWVLTVTRCFFLMEHGTSAFFFARNWLIVLTGNEVLFGVIHSPRSKVTAVGQPAEAGFFPFHLNMTSHSCAAGSLTTRIWLYKG